jgi:hypothetical protein
MEGEDDGKKKQKGMRKDFHRLFLHLVFLFISAFFAFIIIQFDISAFHFSGKSPCPVAGVGEKPYACKIRSIRTFYVYFSFFAAG